ncbi:MAG TPA: hypothetical protein VFE55_22310 [Acidimicrobiia bacterium]|nr:hypothetical protein [Acidimicrobiia bacterium]
MFDGRGVATERDGGVSMLPPATGWRDRLRSTGICGRRYLRERDRSDPTVKPPAPRLDKIVVALDANHDGARLVGADWLLTPVERAR